MRASESQTKKTQTQGRHRDYIVGGEDGAGRSGIHAQSLGLHYTHMSSEPRLASHTIGGQSDLLLYVTRRDDVLSTGYDMMMVGQKGTASTGFVLAYYIYMHDVSTYLSNHGVGGGKCFLQKEVLSLQYPRVRVRTHTCMHEAKEIYIYINKHTIQTRRTYQRE